jgi:RNA polymerase sigma factor (sigma-70 family)
MNTSADPHAPLVARACAGDSAAVEDLIRSVQDQIYGLSLRMLWHPEDARDATQEILIRIVTHLSSFRGESRFTSWCYAIAANYLRGVRHSRLEEAQYTFESFEAELHESSTADSDLEQSADYRVAVEEVKIGCTLGMLLCLDRDHRLAYILGEILELDHIEAAGIAGSTPETYRQRLSRARKAITAFTQRVCGIVNDKNECRCSRRAGCAVRAGRVRLGDPIFGDGVRETASRFGDIERDVRRLEEVRRAAALYRSHPPFHAPRGLLKEIADLLRASGPARPR